MRTLRTLASLVKLEHTIFALPFAYAGMVLGADAANVDVTGPLLVWITLAMVGARTLAMGLNRVIDAQIDARNPSGTTWSQCGTWFETYFCQAMICPLLDVKRFDGKDVTEVHIVGGVHPGQRGPWCRSIRRCPSRSG